MARTCPEVWCGLFSIGVKDCIYHVSLLDFVNMTYAAMAVLRPLFGIYAIVAGTAMCMDICSCHTGWLDLGLRGPHQPDSFYEDAGGDCARHNP